MKTEFGSLNPHHIGMVMREAARQAMIEIRKQRAIFEAKEKVNPLKKGKDLVTSADLAAQKIYLKIISENFPMAGIVAEEDFARECTDPDHKYYFTIDPLDGTAAYGRRQSHAIATMIAFVFDGEICGVTIGDIMTQELFHTRPGSAKVHRISEFQNFEQLKIEIKLLSEQYIQLRQDVRLYSSYVQKQTHPKLGKIKGIEIMGGSIGFMFCRLFKGEAAGIILEPGHQTPWDSAPIMGMSQKLGFKFCYIKKNKVVPFEFKPSTEIQNVEDEMLIIHESNLELFTYKTIIRS